MKKLITSFFLLFLCMTGLAFARPSAPLNKAQIAQVQSIIRTYLVAHPEVLQEAANALQMKQSQAEDAASLKATKENAAFLLGDTLDPVMGNPKGKITMVEFFDYLCPFCRQMQPTVFDLMKKNPNLRVVLKEFPIHGQPAVLGTKVALAAHLQHKYTAMHDELMQLTPNQFTPAGLLKIAQKLKLNIKQFKADVQSKLMNKIIGQNYALARKLKLIGTPAFIIGPTNAKTGKKLYFVGGKAPEKDLQTAIQKAES